MPDTDPEDIYLNTIQKAGIAECKERESTFIVYAFSVADQSAGKEGLVEVKDASQNNPLLFWYR